MPRNAFAFRWYCTVDSCAFLWCSVSNLAAYRYLWTLVVLYDAAYRIEAYVYSAFFMMRRIVFRTCVHRILVVSYNAAYHILQPAHAVQRILVLFFWCRVLNLAACVWILVIFLWCRVSYFAACACNLASCATAWSAGRTTGGFSPPPSITSSPLPASKKGDQAAPFQYCGSGKRCYFDPGIQERFFPDPVLGSQRYPTHISESLVTIFCRKGIIIQCKKAQIFFGTYSKIK